MILPRSLMFIYAVFLTIMTGLYSRNPANLAGTYLFDSIEVKVDETSDKFSTLPLSSLNLAYGAEVFESKLAYIFYHGGDIVELDDKDRNCFYMSQDKTMEMLPSLENPFTVLTRIIFKQDPDTESLCHFKVSNTCKKFKKQANADGSFITIVDHEATIQAWAHLIAHAVSLYELSDDLQIESNSLFNFQKKLIENWKNFVAIDNTSTQKYPTKNKKKIKRERISIFSGSWTVNNPILQATAQFKSNLQEPFSKKQGEWYFDKLFLRCIAYTEKLGFDKGFPLRLLIAAVYEMYGNDQEKIFSFYTALQSVLIDIELKESRYGRIDRFVIKNQHVRDTIARIMVPTKDVLPQPFTKKNYVEDDPSYEAFRLIMQLQGNVASFDEEVVEFSNQEEGKIHFKDQLETIVRKVIVLLLQNACNDASTLHPQYKDFFYRHSYEAQLHEDARSDWDLLLSKKERLLYKKDTQQYELSPCIINFLALLNEIFLLGIPEFQEHHVEIHPTMQNAERNKNFIKQTLPVITELLIRQLGYLVEFEDCIQSDVAGQQYTIQIKTPDIIIKIKFNVGRQAEITQLVNKAADDDSRENVVYTGRFAYLQLLKKYFCKQPINREECLPHHSLVFFEKPLRPEDLQRLISMPLTLNEEFKRLIYVNLCRHETNKEFFVALEAAIHNDFDIDTSLVALATMKNFDFVEQDPEAFEKIISLYGWLIKNNVYICFNYAILAAYKASLHTLREPIYRAGINLFKKLLENGLGGRQAMLAAQELFSRENLLDRSLGLYLWGFLAEFDYKKEYPHIKHMARVAMKSNFESLRERGNMLLGYILGKQNNNHEAGTQFSEVVSFNIRDIEQDIVIRSDKEVLKAIRDNLYSSSFFNKKLGIALLHKTLENTNNFEYVADMARDLMSHGDIEKFWLGTTLMSMLIAKGQASYKIALAAYHALQSDDNYIVHGGVDLLKQLLAAELEYTEVFTAAQYLLDQEDWNKVLMGFELCSKLIEKKQYLHEMAWVALDAIKSKRRSFYSINLLKKLFEKNTGYFEAIDAAQMLIQSADWYKVEAGFEIFSSCVRQGYGFAQAALAARLAVVHPNLAMQSLGLSLFKELFSNGKGFYEAQQVIQAADDVDDPFIQTSIKILTDMMDKVDISQLDDFDSIKYRQLVPVAALDFLYKWNHRFLVQETDFLRKYPIGC